MKTKILFFTMVALLASTTAKAYDFTVGGIYYNITDATNKKVEVTFNMQFQASYSGAVTIPAQVTNGGITYSVTDIGIAAFYNCSGVTSVIIPNSVTSIWLGAFEGCSGLTSVTIPNSVTSIGQSVFASCTGLKSVAVSWTSPPNINANVFNAVTTANVCLYVPTAGQAAYKAAPVWKGFNIQSSTFTVGGINYTVTSANTVKVDTTSTATGAIVIPATVTNSCGTFNVTSIGDNAFANCTGLTSAAIPNSVTSIGGDAFSNCTGLVSITLPNSITSIGDYAFFNCAGLTSLTLPNSLTSIGTSVFGKCSSLTSLTIPNSVTSIGQSAFWGCSGLTSVTIPNSVTSIVDFAFLNCTGLKSVYVSWTTPPTISYFTFENVTLANVCLYVQSPGTVAAYSSADYWGGFNIQSPSFTVGGINYTITSETTVKVDKTPTATGAITIPATVSYGCGTFNVTSIGDEAFKSCTGLTSVSIPNSVTSIGSSAFFYCTGLASVTIPNSVTSIENNAFYYCIALTSVTIPNSVINIEYNAFRDCRGLTSVNIPNSVIHIGGQAFSGCFGLSSVTIPNSVTSIEGAAFEDCTGLKSVTVSWETPLSNIDPYLFDGVTTSNICLYVLSPGTVTAYAAADVWKGFNIQSSSFTVGGINYIVTSATTVKVDKNPSATGDIVIPATVSFGCGTFNVTSIGDNAFLFSFGLTSVNIPSSVTSIGNGTFYGCSGLTSVIIPNSVTSIGADTFDSCTGLTSVTIPNSVTSIGNNAFQNCSGLTSVTIPNSVTNIGNVVFGDCTGLTSISIPNSVTSIGSYAFQNCSGLTSVTIPSSVTSIGTYAFLSCSGLTSVSIPSSVTSIGNNAFNGCSGLKSVSVGWATPLAINANVFRGVTLANVCLYVPSGTEATYRAAAVWRGFNVQSSTFTVGGINYAVTSANTVKVDKNPSATGAITIPATVSYGCGTFNVTSIGSQAFYNCTGLTSVTIPNSVTSIEIFAFQNCPDLTSVAIPNSVTSIGIQAFYACRALTSVAIPNSVKSIGDHAFTGCTGLTSITIPNSVTSIGDHAFAGCIGLKTVTVGWATTLPITADVFYAVTTSNVCLYVLSPGTVGDYAAADVWKGFNVQSPTFTVGGINYTITSSTTVNVDAVPSATGAIVIPATVAYGCGTFNVTSIGDWALSYSNDLTSVTIPNSVTSIGAYAFAYSGALTSVTLSNSLISIGDNAFDSCSGLKSITIPNSVTSIGINAFFGCSSLTSATISNAVTSLGDGVFYQCSSLTSITIPSSVTSIGTYAFDRCTSLKSVTVSWATPIYSYPENFSGLTLSNICLYVPAGTEAAYAAADVWMDFKINASTFNVGGINYTITSDTTVKVDKTPSATGAIVIPATVTYGCGTFNVTSIGDKAFLNTGLSSVTIPNSVTSIGGGAFYNCTGLTSVTIPNSVTNIGASAFMSCTGLKSVTVGWATPLAIDATVFNLITTSNICLYVLSPGKVADYKAASVWKDFKINASTFTVGGINYIITSATTAKVDKTPSATGAITIPATVTNSCGTFNVTGIGYSAFSYCAGITSVTIPNSVTSVEDFAFYRCTSLTSVTIPNSITSIGKSVFYRCSALASITIPNSVTSIGDWAFYNCAALTSLVIPNSVTSIGESAFDSSSGLTSVTIPNSVTSIGGSAFYGCTGLKSVTVSWATPLAVDPNVFGSVTTSNVYLYVPSGTVAIYDTTPVWTDFIIVAAPSVYTRVKALLKGPLSGTAMSTTLNTNNLIPLTHPYSGAPWNYTGTSTESVTTIPANVTDWVLVELRDAATPATVVATRAAFILSDGSIVDVDGVSPVEFKNTAAGNYHIAVKHRNHLAIRTATAQALGTTASGAVLYDFTTAQTQANGTNPMVQSGTVYAMWSGDVNSDGNVYNTATPQDASQVVNGVANKTGNTFHLPSYGGYKSVYNNLDVNMDGNVYNTATPQDASNIVNNVANAPGNTFHLPAYSGLKAKL